MSKRICLALVLSLFLLISSACGGSPDDKGGEVTPPVEEEENDTFNLYGLTVRIGHHHNLDEHFLRYTYTPGSLFEDKARAHMANTEKEVNGVFEYVQVAADWQTTSAALVSAVAVGQNLCDVLFADSAAIIAAATGDCFLPVNTCPDIIDMNDTEKYGTAAMVETMMLNSQPSAVVPALWPDCTPGVISLFIVNNELLSETGLSDPREYVDKNEWNFENFEYFTDNASIIEDGLNIRSVGADMGTFTMLSILSNGVDLIVKDGDGYTTGLSSSETVEALEWCKNYFTKYKDKITVTGVDTGASDGNIVCSLLSNWFIMNELSYKLKDFAVLPFPTGPSAETPDAYRSVIISHYGVSIPSFTIDEIASSVVINRMLEPFADYPDLESLKSYYSQNIFHDPRDIEYVWKVQENCIYNYNRLGGSDIFGNFATNLEKASPAELIESNINKFLDVLNEYMVPNEPYMSTHK